MKSADDFVRRVRRVEVYTESNLECIEFSVARIKNDVDNSRLPLLST